MAKPSNNVEIARRYLQAIEQGATGEALAQFFAPDAICEELPNRLLPQGRRDDLPAILAAAERGRNVLSHQHYEITQVVANNNFVALEVTWIGNLAQPAGTLPAGAEMRAHFAAFLEFRDGKIVTQRNYVCYDSW